MSPDGFLLFHTFGQIPNLSFFPPNLPLLDARSPAEFDKGHIPGAHSFPLFSNEERHQVGLCYKTKGRDAAVKLGLDFVGPKLSGFVDQAKELAPEKELIIHCWRGGMRSGSLSWLLKTAGFEVHTIEGGYKAWRRHIHTLFEKPLFLINVGGHTGSGKTDLLLELKAAGEQVLDLEGLANHKGSAFGNMGKQPTTEHFANLLGQELENLNPSQPIWIEDESKSIGHVFIPIPIRVQMKSAPFILLLRSREERAKRLCLDYGRMENQILIENFRKTERRMGGQFVKAAIEHLENGELNKACEIALAYYDKSYAHALKTTNRKPVFEIDATDQETRAIAKQLIEWKNQNLHSLATAQVVDAK